MADETNTLTVQLMLKDGFVRVDKAHSTLSLRSDFANWFTVSSNAMHQELTGYLDGLFRKRGKLVEQLLTADASKAWKDGAFDAKQLDGWDRITTNWNSEFVWKLKNWIDTHTNLVAGDAKLIYDGLLGLSPSKPLDPAYETSPVEPLPSLLEDSSFGQATGVIQYEIVSPITSRYVSPECIRPRERLGTNGTWPGSITSTNLSRTLEKLKGRLWFRSKIERQLTDYLESRGVPVEVEPQNSRTVPDDRASLKIERPVLTPSGIVQHERILFSHDPLLAGIFVRVAPENTNGLRKALYMVLPSDDFEVITHHLADPQYFQPVLDPFSTSDGQTNYMVHLSLRDPPGCALNLARQYITGSFLAERLRYLGIAGFSAERWNGTNVATSSTNRYKTAELVIAPNAEIAPERNGGGIDFVAGDIMDLPSFAAKLSRQADSVSGFIATNLAEGTLNALSDYQASRSNGPALAVALATNLNLIIQRADVFETNRFSAIMLRTVTKELLKEQADLAGSTNKSFRGSSLAYLNRLLLEDAYPQELATNRLSRVEYDRGTNYAQPESFEAESSKRAEVLPKLTYEPDFPNYFRIGAEYSPKQPLRYFAGYTRAGLAGGPNNLSGQVGWQDGAFGEASYTRDFLFFDSLDRRLQLSVRGFSDYQPDRLLEGQEVNERRSGGEASANLDLFRDLRGHWLRLDLSASYREITLDHSGQRASKEGLTTADVGLLYLYHWDGTPGSARLEVQPNVRLGYGSDPAAYFIRPSVGVTYHRFIGSFVQWECNGSGAWTSSETPISEWPTFGGESSVRGYRADAGVGRTAWAVQNELWLPLRFQFGLPETIDRIVRRNLSLATFVDVGGVYQTSDGDSLSGTKAGAGLGLRFVYNDLTIHLDWAHAINEPDHSLGGSMFYFSVTTRRGF